MKPVDNNNTDDSNNLIPGAIKKIPLIASVVSILGIILIIDYTIQRSEGIFLDPDLHIFNLQPMSMSFIISSFLAIFALTFLSYRAIEIASEKSSQHAELLNKYYEILKRDAPSQRLSVNYLSTLQKYQDSIEIVAKRMATNNISTSELTQVVLDNIKLVFDNLIASKCSVCVKLLNSENNEYVTLFKRDTSSSSDRASGDEANSRQSIKYNTALLRIIDNHYPNTIFICNDPRKMASDGHYQNDNPHWSDYYNATLITPIINPANQIEGTGLLGFLCIDSKYGTFEEEIHATIARFYSNILLINLINDNPRIDK